MNRTNIEWVKNPDGSQGYTHNPMSGCENHTPEGLCLDGLFPCYAYKLANGRLKPLYLANNHYVIPHLEEPQERPRYDPFFPRFWEDRLNDALSHKKQKGIFVCDMGDLFGIGIPEEWTRKVLNEIRYCERRYPKPHRFYLLTKQPQNLIKFSPFPDNCWVGVTATNRKAFTLAIYHLGRIEAEVKYISLEPLLEGVIRGWFNPQSYDDVSDSRVMQNIGIDWLIIGACTGTYSEMSNLVSRLYPNKDNETIYNSAMRIIELSKGRYSFQPKIEWVKEIVEAADKAGIPVFLKNNLKPLLEDCHDIFWENDDGTGLRQELPK